MNKVILTGRLTKEPELRKTTSGVEVCLFTLAVRRNDKETDFFTCKSFNKQATNVQTFCHKGTALLVDGSININSYDNKDGVKVYTTDIIVNYIELIGNKPTESEKKENNTNNQKESKEAPESPKTSNSSIEVNEDELPF